MKRLSSRVRGSTLLLSLSCIAGLAIAAAFTLQRIGPRFQMAAQAAAWQEARLSAEAGIDVALAELEQNAVGFNEGAWSGWSQYDAAGPPLTLMPLGASATLPISAGSGKSNGNSGPGSGGPASRGKGHSAEKEAARAAKKAKKNGNVVPAKADTLGYSNSLLAILGNPVQVSEPIFLDDLKPAAAGNRPTNVDVQLWAVYPTPNPYARWYRLRSVATVALPPTATRTFEKREAEFRRFSLRNVREQLSYDDMGKPTNVPAPSATRIIEVLVEPVLPFQLAILTDQSMKLGTSGTWAVDSFDSTDPEKSVLSGLYPGRISAITQDNGNIGTNGVPAGSVLYGPVIEANGALVRGSVGTNGADDPNTPAHESISAATKIDPDRVRDDFYREMRPLARPTAGIFRQPPPPGAPFEAGSPTQPAVYLVTKDLHDFKVVPPVAGGAGAAVIMVNGDLTVPEGTISIAANVQVQVFVAGNVDFFNRPINVGRRAAQLQIYGEDSKGAPRSLRAFGNASITAAFYGPHYDVRLSDAVEWFGAVAARSFEMVGGGLGGFHYDESLAVVGAPIGFRIARYVEDVRK